MRQSDRVGSGEKHNDVTWKPRERRIKVEGNPEKKKKGQSGSLGPQSFNTTGKDTKRRK